MGASTRLLQRTEGFMIAYATFALPTDKTRPTASTAQPFTLDPRDFPLLDEPLGAEAWIPLLERGLPPNLRSQSTTASTTSTDTTLHISDVAQILLAAQGNKIGAQHGIDLLSYLGIQKRSWPAVVWLVKSLVEAYGVDALSPSPLLDTTCHWKSSHSLDTLTDDHRGFQDALDSGEASIARSPEQATLAQLINVDTEDGRSKGSFAHRALGQVWRSLGNMTIACGGKEMQPEVLELIAYLHHMSIMPASIYNQKPSADITSIQQPPTLNMLSSRILISLSDAAWRARETSLAEETKNETGYFAFLRPKASPHPYRISVAGLRPEVWLELLLWSCLHGGWTLQGASILLSLFDDKSKPQWKPFSWRAHTNSNDAMAPAWDEASYAFNTRRTSNRDHGDQSNQISVEKTVSSEVVNAFIDATVSFPKLSPGHGQGFSLGDVTDTLQALKRFLGRSQLSLVSGTWDGIVLRVIDKFSYHHFRATQFLRLAGLSPAMGSELTSGSPKYVYDGSAAITGLFHRIVQQYVQHGESKQAFNLFQSLQTRADVNKERSLQDFLQKLKRGSREDGAIGLFTDNFQGIAYPDLHIQAPPTLTGPLLDLAIDAGALDFARWLVYSRDVDGPIISERQYAHPAIAPALIRLAGVTNDRQLLARIVKFRQSLVLRDGLVLTQTYLSSFFRSQLERKSWKAASLLLRYLETDSKARFELIDIAHLMRAVLVAQQHSSRGTPEVKADLAAVTELFEKVSKKVTTPIGSSRQWLQGSKRGTTDHLSVMFLVLAYADPYWATYCQDLLRRRKYHTFNIPTKLFNPLLEGIATAYGSLRARQVIGVVWPHELRSRQHVTLGSSMSQAGEMSMSRSNVIASDSNDGARRIVYVLSKPPQQVVLYGGLQPTVATMRILLQAALRDFKSSGHRIDSTDVLQEVTPHGRQFRMTPSAMLFWAIRRMQYVSTTDEHMWEELQAVLSKSELADVQARLADLDAIAESEDSDGVIDEAREAPVHHPTQI